MSMQDKLIELEGVTPPFSSIIHYAKHTSFFSNLRDNFTSFIIWHYPVWGIWLVAGLLMLWVREYLQATTLLILSVIYVTPIIFY